MLNETDEADEGSSAICHGIYVWVVRPRSRTASKLTIASSPYQGDVPNSKVYPVVVAWLREQGVDCDWDCGRMD